MLFNSFIFILIFLPLSLAGWFGWNKLHMPRMAKVFLILMSLWFYGAFGTEFIPVLLTSVFVNYAFSMLSDHIARHALRQVLETAGQENTFEEAFSDQAAQASQREYYSDQEAQASRGEYFSDREAQASQGKHHSDQEEQASQGVYSSGQAERTSSQQYTYGQRKGISLDQRHHEIMRAAARKQKVLMFFGVLFNLLFLAVFKYGNDILSWISAGVPTLSISLPGRAESLVVQVPDSLGMALPVGISFYTFSQISFIVDRCRGDLGHDSFLNYCLSMVFFPKLAEGPITFYQEIGPQFHDPDRKFFRPDNFTRGLCLFILGLAKKVLLADNLAPAVDFGFSNTYYLDTLTVIVTMLAYIFQLYFDFSGYMDMGMGISWMFNIELPLNFDSPFKAVTFSGFWQKWHMTLTRFFTKYVYIPLGGSRHGSLRTMLNIMIVFVLSAFWHGIRWTYLYWGVLCGVLVILCNFLYRRRAQKVKNRAGKFILRLVSVFQFAFVVIFFRANSMEEALAMLRRFFYPTWPGFLYREAATLELPEFYVLQKAVDLYAPGWSDRLQLELLLILLAICIVLVNGRRNAVEIAEGMADAATNMAVDGPEMSEGATPMRKRTAVGLGILFAWCLLSLSGVSTFLYFQF